MPPRTRIAASARIALFLVVVIVPSAVACKNSPDNVCKRLVALTAKKLEKTGLVTKDDKDTMEADCVKNMESKKKDAPKQYACEAACVNDVKDVDDLDPCVKKCPKDE